MQIDSQKNKIIISSILIILILSIVGVFFFKQNKMRLPMGINDEITITGTQGCLPPADPSLPATRECRPGIKTTENSYYALDLQSAAGETFMSTTQPTDVVTIGGGFVPAAALSNDMWQRYAFEGVVTIIEVLEIKRSVVFACEEGKDIKAIFSLIRGDAVTLSLSDGRSMTLSQAISASGSRYATPDERFIFWNKGREAFVVENNQQTFKRCVSEEFAVKG